MRAQNCPAHSIVRQILLWAIENVRDLRLHDMR